MLKKKIFIVENNIEEDADSGKHEEEYRHNSFVGELMHRNPNRVIMVKTCIRRISHLVHRPGSKCLIGSDNRENVTASTHCLP